MTKELFDFVFCCLSEAQKRQIGMAMENITPKTVYYAQDNLVAEKSGYRCDKCGKLYPFLRLDYQNTLIDPKNYAKLAGKNYQYKKAAVAFLERHYYAQNKNTLLKFEVDSDQSVRQTDTIPIMADVYHTIFSQDETYIATETFRGTIEIIDARTKQSVARKQKTPINGSFVFTDEHKLLYFFDDAIRCWDFLEKTDVIILPIPEQWKIHCGNAKVVCNNIFFNSKEQAYMFEFPGRKNTYVVSIKNMRLEREMLLPAVPALCKLVYSEKRNQYTHIDKDHVVIYDSNFDVVERFTPPHIIKIHDGGGKFPITRHKVLHPLRTYLSPDGKWLLLNYFNYVILMRHEDKEIQFCLYSYTGKTAQSMGFIDNDRFWYTWGDTTYIQKMEA